MNQAEALAMFEVDIEEAKVSVTDADVRSIAQLATELQTLENEIVADEAALTTKKEKAHTLSSTTIPEALRKAGVADFTLVDGSQISTDRRYYPSITEANQPAAFAWMEENGHGSLIKHVLTARFGKGEGSKVAAAKAALEGAGTIFNVRKEVHAQTLKAFVKSETEQGHIFPEGTITVFSEPVTQIKRKA